MELIVKKFKELTVGELYEILKLRASVFVVEQRCLYQDIDDKDPKAFHVFLKDESGLAAYLRVLNQGDFLNEVSIGRVIAVKRRCGMGSKIVAAGIQTAVEKFGAEKILVAAQSYAKGFYERQGFLPVSEEFTEDGIPHLYMLYTCK